MRIKRSAQNISFIIRQHKHIYDVLRQIQMNYEDTEYIVDEYTVADLRCLLEKIQQNNNTDEAIAEYMPDDETLTPIKQSLITLSD